MAGVASLRFRKVRGSMEVQTLGRTARGQKYVKGTIKLKAKNPADPEFKNELAAAVTELLDV